MIPLQRDNTDIEGDLTPNLVKLINCILATRIYPELLEKKQRHTHLYGW